MGNSPVLISCTNGKSRGGLPDYHPVHSILSQLSPDIRGRVLARHRISDIWPRAWLVGEVSLDFIDHYPASQEHGITQVIDLLSETSCRPLFDWNELHARLGRRITFVSIKFHDQLTPASDIYR